MPASAMVDVECFRGPGDRPGPDISDGLIVTTTQARKIAEAEIDANWWVVRSIVASHRHAPGVYQDDQIITLDAGEAALPNTRCAIESLAGRLEVREDGSIDLAYTTTVEVYSAPPAGFGS